MKGKILILKTGELPARVCAAHGSCERQFLNLLGADGRAVVIDAQRDNLPETDWSGVIITGSGSSVFDNDRWISRSADFLRRAAEAKTPLYGVCFGHQLLVQAFGGKVERCGQGWELGSVTIRLTSEGEGDQLFAGMPEEFVAQESHRDIVTELPTGAVRLAENDHAPVQAFRLGERIWGTQFHPEYSPPLMRDMIDCLAQNFASEQFAGRPPDRPLREWLLSGVRESADATRCIKNFARQSLYYRP